MAKKDESLQLEGRGSDGWFLAVGLKTGEVVRLGDYDAPAAVQARVLEAQKKPGATVEFSGCRAVANGKLDGWGVYFAEDIRSVRNFGPSVIGAGTVEARIAALEDAQKQVEAAVNEQIQRLAAVEEDVDALAGDEDEIPEAPEVSEETKALIEASKADEEAG